MIRFYPDEEWKELKSEKGALRYKYAISSYGRIISYKEDMQSGKLLKGGVIKGYPVLPLKPFGVRKTLYLHKLIGEYFLEKECGEQQYVIHKDYNKKNNHIGNLQWASKKVMGDHQQNSPYVIECREKAKNRKIQAGVKLTSTDVIRIKKKIFNSKRKTRLKLIAKEFGISEMHLYRIKSGESWSHIVVPAEKKVKKGKE